MVKLTEPMSHEKTERSEDMVGCGTLFVVVMMTSALIFIGFTIYRLFT